MMWPETVSSWTMMLLSVERFFALRFPLQHRRLYRHWHTKALLVAILPFAFLVVLPVIGFALSAIPPENNMPTCYPSIIGYWWLPLIPMLGISVLGFYFYPVSLSLVFTILIIRTLISRDASGKSTSSSGGSASRHDIHAGLTIVILMMVDMLLYAPSTLSLSSYFVIQVVAPDAFWLQGTLAELSYFLFSFTVIKRFCNLYIYLLRVPATRNRLFCRARASSEVSQKN